jgi:hypothetical protein
VKRIVPTGLDVTPASAAVMDDVALSGDDGEVTDKRKCLEIGSYLV